MPNVYLNSVTAGLEFIKCDTVIQERGMCICQEILSGAFQLPKIGAVTCPQHPQRTYRRGPVGFD